MFVMILEMILQEQSVQWNECLRSESCFVETLWSEA